IAVAIQPRDIHGDRVGQSGREVELRALIVEPAVTGLYFSGRREGQVLRRDQDRAAGRVTAEQRALRSFEHLHLIDRQKVQVDAHLIGLIEAIDIDGDVVFLPNADNGGRYAADGRLQVNAGAAELRAHGDLLKPLDAADV